MSRGIVKVYQDAKEQSFSESGLPDEMKDDYEAGWDEQMSHEEQLASMDAQEYERKLGEATEIINFNGMMTLFSDKQHNGKMTDYVIGQIMNGYAPPTLGIGYEVNIVDWVQNPDPANFVVVSSKELVPAEMAAPMIIAAQGHWCLFLRKENLKMFLPPEIIKEQEQVTTDEKLGGKIVEVIFSGYTGMQSKTYGGIESGMFSGRGRLCVEGSTGNLQMMEAPTKGWRFVERVKLQGDRVVTTIESLTQWAESNKVVIDNLTKTSITLKTPKAKALSKAIDKWDFFYVEQDDDLVMVSY